MAYQPATALLRARAIVSFAENAFASGARIDDAFIPFHAGGAVDRQDALTCLLLVIADYYATSGSHRSASAQFHSYTNHSRNIANRIICDGLQGTRATVLLLDLVGFDGFVDWLLSIEPAATGYWLDVLRRLGLDHPTAPVLSPRYVQTLDLDDLSQLIGEAFKVPPPAELRDTGYKVATLGIAQYLTCKSEGLSIRSDGTSEGFGYDSSGNRTAYVKGATSTLSYTAATNRLASSTLPARAWTYDQRGNTSGFTSPTGQAIGIAHNGLNRMATSTLSSQTTVYKVNALGQRVSKSGPFGATLFIYGPDGTLQSEYRTSTGWTNFIRDGKRLVALSRGGALFFVHNDHLDRPEVVTNAAKAVVWSASNFAFDRTVTVDAMGGLNIGLPGQYFDRETGLWQNQFRDYDSSTGRYVQPDPIWIRGGLNAYSYVGGNPVNFVDSAGLDREIIFWSPVRHPGSWFGHVSSVGGNGENYSFGTHGWDKTYPYADDYIARQTHGLGPARTRSGTGLLVGLTQHQDATFDQCMADEKAANEGYSLIANNCTTAAQACLNAAGMALPAAVLPQDFQDNVWNSGSVVDVFQYDKW